MSYNFFAFTPTSQKNLPAALSPLSREQLGKGAAGNKKTNLHFLAGLSVYLLVCKPKFIKERLVDCKTLIAHQNPLPPIRGKRKKLVCLLAGWFDKWFREAAFVTEVVAAKIKNEQVKLSLPNRSQYYNNHYMKWMSILFWKFFKQFFPQPIQKNAHLKLRKFNKTTLSSARNLIFSRP